MAFRCTGCGAIDVVAHEDGEFWWTWGGPEQLPVGVVGRAPTQRERTPPARRSAPARPAPASPEHRAAMREQLARDLAARKDRIL